MMIALVWAGTLNCMSDQMSMLHKASNRHRWQAMSLRYQTEAVCMWEHHTSSAANFNTAVKGASSGTLNLHYPRGSVRALQHGNHFVTVRHQARCCYPALSLDVRGCTHTLKGNFGSDVKVTLNVTFDLHTQAWMRRATHS